MTAHTHDIAPAIHGYLTVLLDDTPAMICEDMDHLTECLGEITDYREAARRTVVMISAEEERWQDMTEDVAAIMARRFDADGMIDADTTQDAFPAFAVAHAPEVCDACIAVSAAHAAGQRAEREQFYSHASRGTTPARTY